MICRIAEHYGGWPHEIAAFPYHYWMALRNEYLSEQEALRKAMTRKPDDEDVIEFDK